jgi:hypothetical protein
MGFSLCCFLLPPGEIYNLKLSWQLNSIKSSWAHGRVVVMSHHITTLMMGTEIVPKTLVSTCNQLARLCAREDFIELLVKLHPC